MSFSAKKIAVIGAGPMGLICALELLKAGFQIDLFEHDDRIGGMSASFDFDGLKIERYYHFICKTDYPLFDLLDELHLTDKLRWRDTKMGFYYEGQLYPWGTPQALLTFPKLDFVSKLRYAALAMYAKRINDWRKYDAINAITWLKTWVGERAYNTLWKPLFELKFHEFTDQLSAAWIGTRIKRIALSRKNLFQEQLGYLEGGSDVVLDALKEHIIARGGQIHLSCGARKFVVENQKVVGLETVQGHHICDGIVSTIPLPYLPRLAPALPDTLISQIKAIQNIAVACVLLKLKHPLTHNFWLNISDSEIAIPGLIEYSNLNPLSNSLVYAPFYMPQNHLKYRAPDADLIEEVLSYLPRINAEFRRDWVLSSKVSRYEFAQTICPPHFFDQLPPMKAPIDGLFMADTAYYYPEDRSISESVQTGKQLAKVVCQSLKIS